MADKDTHSSEFERDGSVGGVGDFLTESVDRGRKIPVAYDRKGGAIEGSVATGFFNTSGSDPAIGSDRDAEDGGSLVARFSGRERVGGKLAGSGNGFAFDLLGESGALARRGLFLGHGIACRFFFPAFFFETLAGDPAYGFFAFELFLLQALGSKFFGELFFDNGGVRP